MDEEHELDSTQVAQMTWFRIPGAKRSTQLSHTPSLEGDFRVWLLEDCVDHNFEIVEVKFSNGQPNYRMQCSECGQHEGSWIPKAKISELKRLPEADLDHRLQYERGRRESWQEIALHHYKNQNKNNRLAYQTYLSSPEWKKRCAKVLERANGICEGCLENSADEVHHITYDHIFEEFLWELRAVCSGCHDRIHPEYLERLFESEEPKGQV